MAFNASVNLGTVGNGITGQTVSISGCTGASCGSGCTSLVTTQAVSSFPKTITGIPDGTVSLFVKVDTGDCTGTSQCITISGIPGATATPTSTPTSTTVDPTITPTTTPTVNPTITPTTTTTPTINPTITPTTTTTPSITYYGCGDTVSDTYTPSTFTTQTKYLDLSEATNGDTITISYTANDRPNRFNIYGDGFLVTSSLWAGTDPDMGTTYTGPWTGNPIDSDGTGTITFTYAAGTSYELRVDVGAANPNATPVPNPSDAWSVTISCSTVSPTLTPTFYAYCYEIVFPLSIAESSGEKLRISYQKADYTNVEFYYDEFPDSGANSPNYTINVCSRVQPSFRYGLFGQYFAPDAQLTVTQGEICNSTTECGGSDPVPVTPTPTFTQQSGSYCYTYQTVAYGPYQSLQDCQAAISQNGHIASCYECIDGPQAPQTE